MLPRQLKYIVVRGDAHEQSDAQLHTVSRAIGNMPQGCQRLDIPKRSRANPATAAAILGRTKNLYKQLWCAGEGKSLGLGPAAGRFAQILHKLEEGLLWNYSMVAGGSLNGFHEGAMLLQTSLNPKP